MSFKKYLILSIVLLISCEIFSQEKLNWQKNLPSKLVDNFIYLYPDSIAYPDEPKSHKWNYEQGLMYEAIYRLYEKTNNKKYLNYIKKNLDYYIQTNGDIKTYKQDEFNLDNINPGRALLNFYEITGKEKYKIAADHLREQLKNHPRTIEGGFWHKKVYPFQMWLDGLYMAQPFYLRYAIKFNDSAAVNDVINQFEYINKHLFDTRTGLYFHGWDESKKQLWANPVTGVSPNFWGRSIGWFIMAVIDVLDYLPKEHPRRKMFIETMQNLSKAILKYRDDKTLLWYQVIDKGDSSGNYIETSASLMFIYAFAKGANKGYLNVTYLDYAKESFESLLKNFVTMEKGKIYLHNVCKVGGLGGNPYRDGSFKYYISEPKRINDFKGYGPFILASLEIEKWEEYKKIGKNKVIGLDYFYNNEYKDGKRFHYIWDDEEFSGFSELGKIFSSYGGKITQVFTEPSKKDLDKLSVYIVVDPDNEKENANPNIITNYAANIIVEWVRKGGVLMMFANDSGNCNLNSLNILAEKFYLKFNHDCFNNVIGKNYEMGKFDNLPEHEIFKNVSRIYLKEICSISLKNKAIPILQREGKTFVAGIQYGKGYVLAIGDPWLYNEYIDNRKLPHDFENYISAKNICKYILQKSNKVK